MGTDMETGQQNAGRGGTYRAALAAVIILSLLLVAGVVALMGPRTNGLVLEEIAR